MTPISPRSNRSRQVHVIARAVLLRLGGLVVVLWGTVTLAFFALKLVRGNPVDIMLGTHGQIAPSRRAEIESDWGLDLSWGEQYIRYVVRVLSGDLGTSYQLRKPVAQIIGDQLVPTLQLSATALLIATLLVSLGALLGRRRWMRRVLGTVELVAVSAPIFWTALLLLTVFSFALGWFPVSGSRGLNSLVLPAVTIAIPVSAMVGQMLRQGIERAEAEPFIETVRARGVGPGRLLTHHTLRHAANNTLTLGAYIAGSLVGGAVLVETIFGRSGLGRVMLTAILGRDIPVVLGAILVIALVFVVVNTAVDVLSAVIDPRLSGSFVGASLVVAGER
ncbi:ABC transporter permease [Klugiella xanthotipulae]|uniref:Peptide/nickel transport system permease protein n=1 Tax=Klugiella xanthotipulae TaxID=244735 RepID=A0A543HSJ3_9MICO|nr:ABC transporter permease [Klugiella xanthotipulae]TQM61302.1 peptide/nickel transport system permease protein [Klugiella xanthotipulae]